MHPVTMDEDADLVINVDDFMGGDEDAYDTASNFEARVASTLRKRERGRERGCGCGCWCWCVRVRACLCTRVLCLSMAL